MPREAPVRRSARAQCWIHRHPARRRRHARPGRRRRRPGLVKRSRAPMTFRCACCLVVGDIRLSFHPCGVTELIAILWLMVGKSRHSRLRLSCNTQANHVGRPEGRANADHKSGFSSHAAGPNAARADLLDPDTGIRSFGRRSHQIELRFRDDGRWRREAWH